MRAGPPLCQDHARDGGRRCRSRLDTDRNRPPARFKLTHYRQRVHREEGTNRISIRTPRLCWSSSARTALPTWTRPARRLGAERDPHPRRRHQPEVVQVGAAHRGNRNSLHRMRLLRSGLPQPQHHRYPAAADRAAPGNGPPARRIAPARPAAGRIRIRRHRDLRRGRQLRDPVPGPDHHRRAGKDVPPDAPPMGTMSTR